MCSCACGWRNLGCYGSCLVSAISWLVVPPPWEDAARQSCSMHGLSTVSGCPSVPWVLPPAPGLRVTSHGQPDDQRQPTSNHSLSWEDMRSRDLNRCCGIWAGYNRFMDLHRYKLTALGKSSNTAPILIKMPKQKTVLSHAAGSVGITALRDCWALQPTSVQRQTD